MLYVLLSDEERTRGKSEGKHDCVLALMDA